MTLRELLSTFYLKGISNSRGAKLMQRMRRCDTAALQTHTEAGKAELFYIKGLEPKRPKMVRDAKRISLSLVITLVVVLIVGTMVFALSFAPEVYAATDTVASCDQATLNNTINSAAAGDTINFTCSGTITLSATIDITKTLTIDGVGQTVTLSGNNAVEVLKIEAGVDFTLANMTITHGHAPTSTCNTSFACGGGIGNSGILTITNSAFLTNTATYGGGAIYNSSGGIISSVSNSIFSKSGAFLGGVLYNNTGGKIGSISNSTFSLNSASGEGGVIYNNGGSIASIDNSTFSSNSTTISSGSGGVIYNGGSIGSISNSSFYSNKAPSLGGVIEDSFGASIHSISSSSFYSNTGSVQGGVIFDASTGIPTFISNSTFYGNSSNEGGAIYNNTAISIISNTTFVSNSATKGGAIENGGGTLQVINSIFAQGSKGVNCVILNGTIKDSGGNLSDDGSCNFSSPNRNNVPNLNMGPLQNNGGSTLTVALLPESAALFASLPAACPTTDQRGQARPQPAATDCDTGAYESAYQLTPNITVQSNPNPSYLDQNVLFSATIAATGIVTPTGSLVFTDTTDNVSLGAAPIDPNGNALLTIPTFSKAGSYNLAIGYSGDITFTSAITNFVQVVNLRPTTNTITTTTNPSYVGQSLTFTATVSNNSSSFTPAGTVTFTNTTTNQLLGTATLANGVATLNTTFSMAGNYTITASYGGDNFDLGSTNTILQQVVTPPPPTIAIFAGNGQSTPVSTAFPVQLQAIVRDGLTGNPLAGMQVVFQAPSSGASGTFSPTSSTIFTATTDTNGVATTSIFTANSTVGSYQVTASTSGAASPATFNLVNNMPNTPSGYSYYLPFLANNANNFTTFLIFQNTANISSSVSISFFDNNGNSVPAANGTCSSVVALGECIVPNPFAVGSQGEGVIVSQQPLNVIVSEATPFGGSAYAVPAGASNNLIAPVAIKGGLVDFTTQLSIFNGGNSSVNGTVQFFDSNGNHISAADKTFSLSAHSTTIYDQAQDTTLSNFYGWAQVVSPAGSTLVAQTLEQRPSVKFVAIVNAQFNPQTTLYAPAIFNGAFGSFVTGANLVNPASQPVTITLTYYKNDGTAVTTTPFTIAGNAVTGIFQGGTSGVGLPTGGLPNGWYGAATVKASGGSGIIMFVNEQGGLTATGSDQSGTYGAAVSGSSVIGLPVMANGAFGGYITGATIENITNSPVTANVQYYDLSGNTVGTAKSVTIGGNASYVLYQGGSDQALPSGFYGTAQITVTGGPSSSLLVTTNAQSNAFFYSYTEPNF
jgi:hypothetical protein